MRNEELRSHDFNIYILKTMYLNLQLSFCKINLNGAFFRVIGNFKNKKFDFLLN